MPPHHAPSAESRVLPTVAVAALGASVLNPATASAASVGGVGSLPGLLSRGINPSL